MSDSDIDDVVDNQVNESVDWGVDLNENNGADNADRLETIIEESYISTVSKRPKSSEKSVIISIEKDISRSFTTEDGLCGSFMAPNRTSDSADFVGNGPDKQSIFDAEFEKLNSSGRRLQLPETFNAEKYNRKNSNMNNSWDKGPYVHTRTPPTTPRRGQPKIEEKKKPVRLRSEHKSQFRSTHVPTSTNTSTPKQREPVSRLPDWELSCINASNTIMNATMNNTSGIPAQVVAQNIQSLPATANAQEVFAVLEKLRLEKLHKQTKRDQEKNSFFSSIKSKKKAVDVQRLATLEEEKLVSSPLIHASSIQKSAKKKTVELTAQITRQIIHSANAPAAIGPYSQAVRVDNTIYISGSLGLDPKTMQLEKGIKKQTHLALKNIGEILKAAGVGFENVVKTTVLLSDIGNYQIVNEIYKQYFTEKFPARAAYQVVALPKGGLVEIEAIAVVGKMKDI